MVTKVMGVRLRDWVWRGRMRGKDLQLAYLLLSVAWPTNSREYLWGLGLGTERIVVEGGKLGGEDLCNPLEIGTWGERRFLWVVCNRAQDERGEEDLQ